VREHVKKSVHQFIIHRYSSHLHRFCSRSRLPIPAHVCDFPRVPPIVVDQLWGARDRDCVVSPLRRRSKPITQERMLGCLRQRERIARTDELGAAGHLFRLVASPPGRLHRELTHDIPELRGQALFFRAEKVHLVHGHQLRSVGQPHIATTTSDGLRRPRGPLRALRPRGSLRVLSLRPRGSGRGLI
jgi:hypothetical protein